MAKIEEPKVHVYLKIFGILQFRLFSGFLKKSLAGNPKWSDLNDENWYDDFK